MDYALVHCEAARCFVTKSVRPYVLTMQRSDLTVIGHLSQQNWIRVDPVSGPHCNLISLISISLDLYPVRTL